MGFSFLNLVYNNFMANTIGRAYILDSDLPIKKRNCLSDFKEDLFL